MFYIANCSLTMCTFVKDFYGENWLVENDKYELRARQGGFDASQCQLQQRQWRWSNVDGVDAPDVQYCDAPDTQHWLKLMHRDAMQRTQHWLKPPWCTLRPPTQSMWCTPQYHPQPQPHPLIICSAMSTPAAAAEGWQSPRQQHQEQSQHRHQHIHQSLVVIVI